jgi:RNA-directed DNA polymerase
VRQFPVGKYRSGRDRYGHHLGFKTLIKPSKDAQKRHLADLAEVIRRNQQLRQDLLIHLLNPKILGWARYHSAVVAKEVFSRMDALLFAKLRSWARRRHPNKGGKWVAKHYWRPTGARRWVFKSRDGSELAFHADIPIVRHAKVEGARSPFDGDWAYWATRMGRHPEVTPRVATLLKAQRGKCVRCGLFFRDTDLLEVDHIVPLAKGGFDRYDNWQLLHRHCHDAKTAGDGSLARSSTRDLIPTG